jgi:hypothetical protein
MAMSVSLKARTHGSFLQTLNLTLSENASLRSRALDRNCCTGGATSLEKLTRISDDRDIGIGEWPSADI